MKKVLKFTVISLVSLLVLLFVLPFLFKDKLLATVKEEINRSVTARVEFKDLNLSFFRHFPKLAIGLEDLSVTGLEEFRADTLLSARRLDVSVNLFSLLGDSPEAHGVYLKQPRIHALVTKGGKSNWDIAKEDTVSSSSSDSTSAFAFSLQKYAIEDGYVLYRDEQAGMEAEIAGLYHEGSGNFTQDLFTLSTKTKAESASFTYAHIPYLIKAETGIDADIEIDNKSAIYKFRDAALSVNNLKLESNGFFQLVNDSTYNMDISFKAPSNDFKDLLSLVPSVYKNDFADLKTSGTATLNGFVKGIYGPKQIPAYKVDVDVKDGFFQYPDLPQPVKNIQLEMHLSNPDGNMDHTVIDITKGHLEMGNEPFDFRLLFRNPETSRYIDAVIKGKLNLAEMSRFVKLEQGTKLAGTVLADVFAKGALAALGQGGGAFSAGGFLDIRDLYYAANDFPQPIQKGNIKVELENTGGIADATVVRIPAGHVEVGKDPVDFTLSIQKPVTSLDFSGTAKGRFYLQGIKQFVALEAGTSVSGLVNADLAFSGSKAAIDKKQYDQISTSGLVNLSNINYVSKEYPKGAQISKAQLTFNSKAVTLNSLVARFQNTNFTANGVLNNLVGYALSDAPLGGTVNLAADKLNLNEWMGTDTTASSGPEETAPFAVPANIDLTLNAKADAVQYDKVTYSNVRGALQVKDETVQLQNVQTDALGGSVTFNGSYSTKQSKAAPAVALSYNVKEVDVQKAFLAYNTVQKLMPIGKFLSGKLTSQLSLTGKLNGDMKPDFSSLTGNGNLLVIEGVLRQFAPLEKLASTLNINELKDLAIKDIKSHIEFTNGKVLVKPFDVKVKDIAMQVGGMHGFDQSMDYIVAMKLPRKYLGTQGNALVNSLATQASNKGIPVSLGEVIDLNVKMGGSLTAPTVKTDLKAAAGDATQELKQQATAFAQQRIDSAKRTVKDSLKVVKQQVAQDLKNEAVKQLFGAKDSTSAGSGLEGSKKKAEQTIKNTLDNLLNRKKKSSADSTSTSMQ